VAFSRLGTAPLPCAAARHERWKLAAVHFLAIGGSTFRRHYADTAAVLVVLNGSLDEGKEREIGSLADAAAGMEAVADLSNENIARYDSLAAEALYPAALAVGIAAIAARALTFLMCHPRTPYEQ
jgi:hypothetical protein